MDEGRKRVLGIMASILAARKRLSTIPIGEYQRTMYQCEMKEYALSSFV